MTNFFKLILHELQHIIRERNASQPDVNHQNSVSLNQPLNFLSYDEQKPLTCSKITKHSKVTTSRVSAIKLIGWPLSSHRNKLLKLPTGSLPCAVCSLYEFAVTPSIRFFERFILPVIK